MTTQVKKLQVMLRQANDQLEKTMKEKQELEDYMKQSAEDSSNQVQGFVIQVQEWWNVLQKYVTSTCGFLDMDGLLAVETPQMRIPIVSYAPPESVTVSREIYCVSNIVLPNFGIKISSLILNSITEWQ